MSVTKRTLVISDIHTDINKAYPVVEELTAYARRQQAECILIAGDICENIYTVMETVKRLKKEAKAEVYYVPGNHDMWHTEQIKLGTDEIYKLFSQDENCLCGKQVRVGNHIVIGDIGWYDYSFGDKEFTKEDFDRMEHDGRVWQDRFYNDWTKDNIGKTRWFLERLEERFKAALQEADGREPLSIAVVTHMLPHKAYTVPTKERPMWKYFNAFLGSGELGALYRKYPVEYAICGHVHYRHDFTENGIQYMCRCLNYASEWWGEKDVKTQIRQAASVIEL